jgi:hypothetical protein
VPINHEHPVQHEGMEVDVEIGARRRRHYVGRDDAGIPVLYAGRRQSRPGTARDPIIDAEASFKVGRVVIVEAVGASNQRSGLAPVCKLFNASRSAA